MDLNHYSVLGSDERRITDEGFVGGRVTAVLSELELELREATTADVPAVIELRTLLAEVDVTVPDDWRVDVRLSTPLCEFRDRRAHTTTDERTSDERATRGPDLVLTGFGVLSEITLRN